MKKLQEHFDGARSYHLALLPLILLMFPFRGIVHDTRLYVFDILNRTQNGVFVNDLLAVGGTQDKYTLFSYIAAPLYQVFSPWVATALLYAVGQIIWFSGIIALVSKITADGKTAFFGLLSVVLLPALYFGFSVLSYGEPFATPRLFVEGLTFWSLWCFFNRAYVVSGLLVVVAMTLHPIMGLIAAALIIGILLQESRRWWLVFGLGSIAGLALALGSGLVPHERLTATLDGDWLRVVQQRAKYLYLAEWLTKDWARILLAVSVTVPLAALYTGWRRRLIVSAWIVGGAGLLVSFVGTDLLHNVLLSQVQTSRTIWFVYLLGNVGLGVVVANLYKKSEADGDALLFLYVLAWMVTHILWPVPGLILGLAASSLAHLRITEKIVGIPSLLRRLIYMSSLILLAGLLFFRLKFWLVPENRGAIFSDSEAFLGLSGFTHAELVVVALVIFSVSRMRLEIPASVTKGLLILLAVWSIFVWDRRSMETRGLEGGFDVAVLVEHIPEGAQVYWEGSAKGAWFLLGRPSYFASIQGAGTVFAEPLAEEFWRRSLIVHELDGVDYVDIWHAFKTQEEREAWSEVQKELDRNDLVTACTNAPELDFMVLTRKVDGAYLADWYPQVNARAPDAPPVRGEMLPEKSRYLYRCADFR